MPLVAYRCFKTKAPEIFIWVHGSRTDFGDELWHAHLGPKMEGGMRDDVNSVSGMGFTRGEAFKSLRQQVNTVLKWHTHGSL